jgi:hypothetical protein
MARSDDLDSTYQPYIKTDRKSMTNKTDWAIITAAKLFELTTAVMRVQNIDAENALECVLSSTCAGPKAIEMAQVALGLKRNE